VLKCRITSFFEKKNEVMRHFSTKLICLQEPLAKVLVPAIKMASLVTVRASRRNFGTATNGKLSQAGIMCTHTHTHVHQTHQAPKVSHTLMAVPLCFRILMNTEFIMGSVLLMSGSWSQTALSTHTARLSGDSHPTHPSVAPPAHKAWLI